ncbi:MAG: acyltransferase family protein [Oscillospiraceae bacterium]|jgi:fucose 4-O-acetylase-like acetyltransferase|nr:acyltransferase family protein [Oscillospiraceae bacterium]
MQKERLAWIDIARGFGICLIVLGHVNQYCGPRIVYNYIYSFHVPLFFLISGLVFSVASPPKEFFFKKIRTLLIPFFVFAYLSMLVFYITTDGLGIDLPFRYQLYHPIWKAALNVIYGSTIQGHLFANTPLWFLPCIFALQAIYYPIEKYLIKKYNWGVYGHISLGVLVFLIVSMIPLPDMPFSMSQALHMLPFFALGRVIGCTPSLLKTGAKRQEIPLALLLIAAGFCLSLKEAHSPSVSTNMYLYYAFDMFKAAISCTGWILLLRHWKNRNEAFIYLGKNTTGILCLHKLPILFLQAWPLTVTIFKPPFWEAASTAEAVLTTLITLIAAALCILLCVAAGELIKRFCPIILGLKKAKKA